MRKYRVLLVDDNPVIRDGIRAMVDWNSLGYQLEGTADNGVNALAFLQETPCDLLITDIRMPEMDGIELIRRIRETQKDIEVIVISAYGEFDYAHATMQYGVENYLLKPVSSDKLIESLLMVRTTLEEREKNRRYAFEQALLKLLITPQKASIRQAELQRVGFNPDAEYYAPVLLHLDAFDERVINLYGDNEESMTALDVVTGFLDRFCRSYSTVLAQDLMLIVLMPETGMRSEMKAIISDLTEYLELYSGAHILAVVGDIVTDVSRLSAAYLKLQAAMNNEDLWEGHGSMVADVSISNAALDIEPLLNAMHSMNIGAAVGECRQLTQSFENGRHTIDQIRETVSEIILRLSDIVSEYGGDAEEALHSANSREELYRISRTAELSEYLSGIVEHTCEYLNRLIKKDGQIRVSDIVNYIDAHYAEAITVKKLSEIFYISPVYLGRLFTAKMGLSLNNYVNSVRIRNAQTMLTGTDLKVYAICNNVGYKSIKYFYKVFKDEVGMTPLEYRLIHGM